MRSTPLILALGLALAFGISDALAADFDGRWVADIPKQNGCDIPGEMTLLVSGGDVMGEVHRTVGANLDTTGIAGKVNADGAATAFKVGAAPEGTLRFSGDRFDATWNNGHCERHVEGVRAPDAAAQARAAADRKDHQALYASLVQRAESGDRNLDYAALRAESVYAAGWDFYDDKAGALLDQAAAAVRGDDCASAMTMLDQALKLDFTLDSAHALRADCLRKAGDEAGARIEAGIADGLIHALMDSPGGAPGLIPASASEDGSSEARAYVVVTDREAQDVLANRHIQVNYRQTQIRGADGRYFELVKGVAIGSGPTANATVASVYFDVTSFMTGQASRRAARTTAVAAIH